MVSRDRAAGHALLLALVALLVTSLAAGLVAGTLALEQRQHLRQVESARLRALLDAAVSTAVARVVEDARYTGHEEVFGGGFFVVEAERTGKATVSLRIGARYRSRVAAGEATIALLTEDGPKVVRWRALPAPAVPLGLRRRLDAS